MAITAYAPCNPVTYPSLTPEAACVEEGSRIVGAILMKLGFDVENLTDAASITTAIAAGDIRIVKGITGNWNAPTVNKKPGMAFQREKFSSLSYSIPFKHYGVDANLAFWNTVNHQRNWGMAMVFEDMVAYAALERDKAIIPMDIAAYPVSDEELNNSRRIEGLAEWTSNDLPYKLTDLTAAALAANFR